MAISQRLQQYRFAILLILPIIYLLVGSVYHQTFGNFYQFSVDPEYSIIYNAILVASGNLAINFIAHPATPLIYLSAISSRIVHFLTSDESLKEDFLSNPEKYIHAANTFINLLIAGILFLSAIHLAKRTKSLYLPLLLQLSIFANQNTLGLSARLIPELSMLIPIILISCLTIDYIINTKNNIGKYIRQFPILIAFGIACKLNFAPLIILPLILIKTHWKNHLKLLGNTILFTAIFAYPLLTNFSESSKWISSIFIHSGTHGAGESNIINWTTAPGYFFDLFDLDPILFCIIPLCFLFCGIQLFKKRKTIKERKITSAILGISLSILVLILLNVKHFALHYLMPFLFFKSILIILLTWAIQQSYKFRASKIKFFKVAIAILLFAICIHETSQLKAYHVKNQRIKSERLSDYRAITNLIDKEDAAIITIPKYTGSPFIEYAHCYGFMYSYRRKNFFKEELKAEFPNFYCHVDWTKKFNHWDEFVALEKIIKRHDIVYIFAENEGDFSKVKTQLENLKKIIPLKNTTLFKNDELNLISVKVKKRRNINAAN